MAQPSLSPGPATRHLSERELTVMVALVQSLQALAIDAMLPALPLIGSELHVSNANHRQFVVGLFLAGISLGSLVPGPLADRFGRRIVLLVGLACYVLLSAACAVTTEFNTLLILRILCGLACASMAVVPAALIRDRFEGDRMARLLSLVSVIFLLVPMIAPSIGQAILLVAGWRWIFGLMALIGMGMFAWVALRLPETLLPEARQAIRPRVIWTNMTATFSNRSALGYVLASACPVGIAWGWVQSCEQLLGEHFGAGRNFPYYFGGIALFLASGNFANSRIVLRFGARSVAHSAVLAYLSLGFLHVYFASTGHQTLWQFVPLMALTVMMAGLMNANLSSIALQPFALTAGSASSVQSFIRMTIGAIVGALIGQSYDGTARPLAFAILTAGVMALSLVLWSERGRLFRRVMPAGGLRPA